MYSYIQNLVIGNSKAQGHSQGQGHHQGGGHNIYFKIICFPTKKSEMQMKKIHILVGSLKIFQHFAPENTISDHPIILSAGK